MVIVDKDEFEVEAEKAEEDEETLLAFIHDAKEDVDFDGYELLPDSEERIVNWDDDDYEYYYDESEESVLIPYDVED